RNRPRQATSSAGASVSLTPPIRASASRLPIIDSVPSTVSGYSERDNSRAPDSRAASLRDSSRDNPRDNGSHHSSRPVGSGGVGASGTERSVSHTFNVAG
ncbi:unnamed protein product, partial [Sphacelaria rigidula]